MKFFASLFILAIAQTSFALEQNPHLADLHKKFLQKSTKSALCYSRLNENDTSTWVTEQQCILALERLLSQPTRLSALKDKAFDWVGLGEDLEPIKVQKYYDVLLTDLGVQASTETMFEHLERQFDKSSVEYENYLRRIEEDRLASIELVNHIADVYDIKANCEFELPSKRCRLGLTTLDQALSEVENYYKINRIELFDGGGAARTGSFLKLAVSTDLKIMKLVIDP